MNSPYNKWSNSRFKSFITSTLRGGYRRFPPKFEVFKEACVGKKLNKKTGRQALHYTCSKCKKDFPSSEVEVDHIKPVVDPKEGFISWDVFIERLYCPKENLQVLCKPCHSKKTTKEKKQRNESN